MTSSKRPAVHRKQQEIGAIGNHAEKVLMRGSKIWQTFWLFSQITNILWARKLCQQPLRTRI